MSVRIFSFLLLTCFAALGQPFYIDQLNSRNVLIGDDANYPPTPLPGTLRFMTPLLGPSSNAPIACIEDAEPGGVIKSMVFGGAANIDYLGNINSGNNFYGYGLFIGPGAHTAGGWDPITQVWFGDGSGLTNITGTVGLTITQHITDFILGSITNVYSNGLLVATGAYVVPPAAGLQGAGGDNMLGAYGESLEPAG